MWTDRLVELNACTEAVEWASSYPTLEAAWAACERGDWMLWLAGRIAGPPGDERRRPLVLAACECAELAMPAWETRYSDDRRPQEALRVARAWARGEVDLGEVRSATYDTYGAAHAVAAVYAAVAAVYAAAAADYAAYAAYAAADALARCADIVRRHYPEPPVLPGEGVGSGPGMGVSGVGGDSVSAC